MIWSSDVHASWQDVMTAINDDYWDTLRSGSTYHGKPSRIERCKGRTSTFHLCNGDPIAEMESGCTTFTAFNTTGFSVVRTTTPKGIPVVIIDGSHYILPRSMDIAAPDHTLLNYRYGSYVDDPTYGDVPLFFAD